VRSAFGFTVKSGWACALVLDGDADRLVLVDSRRIELSDPGIPDARQPYHRAAGTARTPGRRLDQLLASVEQYGQGSVGQFIGDSEQGGRRFAGAAIVVGSLIDPSAIANDHIRIHALEGRLFRGVVTRATDRCHLASLVVRERDLYELAATRLKRSASAIKKAVDALGAPGTGPWRAEHKAAALGAWLVIADSRRFRRTTGVVFK
jgi:hypothetical protein